MMWSPGAKTLIECMRLHQDQSQAMYGTLWWHDLLGLLTNLSVADASLPLTLADDAVWPEARRRVYFAQPYTGPRGGLNYFLFVREVWALAEREKASRVTEWHIVKVMCDGNPPNVGGHRNIWEAIGIDVDRLLNRISQESGRRDLTATERAKVWCFCDTSLFLQYRFFDEVDWCAELTLPPVVLVIPAVVTAELDNHKGNPDRNRERQRGRAKKVIRRVRDLAFSAPPRTPAAVRNGVELLALGHEPTTFPEGLDPLVADERLIASALEFRWSRVGSRIAILSGDLALSLKAYEHGLEIPELPEHLQMPAAQPSDQAT